jgi:hypothetical protein
VSGDAIGVEGRKFVSRAKSIGSEATGSEIHTTGICDN